MGFKGDLSTISLADVFQTLSATQKEGTLSVGDDESRKVIYFGSGGIQLLSSGKRKGAHLGQMLVRNGQITEDQLTAALERQKETGERLGESLIGMGAVSQEAIDALIRDQIEEEIFDLFSWKKAAFEFVDGPPPAELNDPNRRATQLTFDVNSLVLEAARRIDEWEIIQKAIPNPENAIYIPTEDHPTPPAVADDEEQMTQRIWPLIDGMHSVDEIVLASTLSRFSVCRAFHQLVLASAIREVTAEDLQVLGREMAGNRRLDEAALAFQRAHERAPQKLGLHQEYAQILLDAGKNRESAEEYRLIGDKLREGRDENAAIGAYNDALRALPEDITARRALLQIYLGRKDQDRSSQLAKDLVERGIAGGDLSGARQVCESLLEVFPKLFDFRIHIVNIYADLKDHEASLRHLGRALDLLPASDRQDIAVVYEKILAIDPSRTEVRAKLEMLLEERRQAARRRRRIKLVSFAALFAATLGISTWIYRGAARGALLKAMEDSIVLEKRGELEAARNLVLGVRQTYIFGGISAEADARIEKLDQKITLIKDPKYFEQQAREEFAKINAQAQDHIEKHEYDKAIALYDEFIKGKFRLSSQVQGANSSVTSAKVRRDEYERKLRQNEEIAQLREKLTKDMEDAVVVLRRAHLAEAEKLFLEIRRRAENSPLVDFVSRADEHLSQIRKYHDAGADILRQAREAEANGLFAEACRWISRLLADYPQSEAAAKATYPLQIRTRPTGARVLYDGKPAGSTPLTLQMQPVPQQPVIVWLELEGFDPRKLTLTKPAQAVLDLALQRHMIWSFQAQGPVETPALAVDGAILVGSRDGRVYGLKPDSGVAVWTFALENNADVATSLLPVGENVLFGCNDNALYALNPKTRASAWRFTAKGFVQTTPILDSDGRTVFFADAGGNVHCLDGNLGTPKWSAPLPAPPSGALRIVGNRLLIGTEAGHIVAFPTGGAEAPEWKVTAPGSVFLAGSDGTESVLATAGTGKLLRISPADGSTLWQRDLSGPVSCAPLVKDGRVYAGTLQGIVHAFNIEDGIPIWEPPYKVDGAVQASPAIIGGELLIGTRKGTLFAISPKDGAPIWEYHAESPISAPVSSSGKALLVSCEDHHVYALER